METVKVRNLIIGTGIPKICVPILCRTQEEILTAAENIADAGVADLAEWRADGYKDAGSPEKIEETGQALREILGDMPLLFTYRTAREGGERQNGTISPEAYVQMNQTAVKSGLFDLLDVELKAGEEAVHGLLETAHANGVRCIVSSHDFVKTPPREEIVARLRKMQDMGADLPKVAVMPKDDEDVRTLLDATMEMSYNYAARPIITISMSERGALSRLVGELYGSAVTFGTVGKSSAPGQIDAVSLKEMLVLIHGSQGNPSIFPGKGR